MNVYNTKGQTIRYSYYGQEFTGKVVSIRNLTVPTKIPVVLVQTDKHMLSVTVSGKAHNYNGFSTWIIEHKPTMTKEEAIALLIEKFGVDHPVVKNIK